MCFPVKSLVSQDDLHTGGTQKSVPAHFLPREKCSHHSFPFKGGDSCVGTAPGPRDDFLIEGNQTLVRTPGSKEAPLFDFFPLPGLGWKGLMAPTLGISLLL